MTPIEMTIDEQPTQEQLGTVEQSTNANNDSEHIMMVKLTENNNSTNDLQKKVVQINESYNSELQDKAPVF